MLREYFKLSNTWIPASTGMTAVKMGVIREISVIRGQKGSFSSCFNDIISQLNKDSHETLAFTTDC